MISTIECLTSLRSKGAEISVISVPREVLIDCRGSQVTDNELRGICAISDLTHLWLEGCAVSEVAVGALCTHLRLQYLDIGHSNCDGIILRQLSRIASLEGICLAGLDHVSVNLKYFFGHPKLDRINFSETDVTTKDIKQLISRSVVTGLILSDTKVVESDLREFLENIKDDARTIFLDFARR